MTDFLDFCIYSVIMDFWKRVEEELEFKIKNGMKIENNWNIEDKVLFKNKDNKLLGIYEVVDNQLKVWKNFHE